MFDISSVVTSTIDEDSYIPIALNQPQDKLNKSIEVFPNPALIFLDISVYS